MNASIFFTISRSAMKLVKSGQAVISSGGVRSLSGKLIELARPCSGVNMSGILGNVGGISPLSAVNIASSLASNVQCAYIQKGINVANAKLDDVIASLTNISNSLHSLQQIQALSWVTTAFSLANCGISLAGFAITLKRLESVDGHLKEFYDRYRQDRDSDKFLKYSEYLGIMKDHLVYLQERYINDTFDDLTFKNRCIAMEESLTVTGAFIKSIKDEFSKNHIDKHMACQMIFTIIPVYSQLLREYTGQYHYVYNCTHKRYNEWLSVINEVNSIEFKNMVKSHLLIDIPDISPSLKNQAYLLAFRSITEQQNNLLTSARLIEAISEDDYFSLDDQLNRRIYEDLSATNPIFDGIELDKELVARIMSDNFCNISNTDMIAIQF